MNAIRLRQGRRNPQNVYRQRGDEPSDNDEFVLVGVGGPQRGAAMALEAVRGTAALHLLAEIIDMHGPPTPHGNCRECGKLWPCPTSVTAHRFLLA
jgi:hypothetical protein